MSDQQEIHRERWAYILDAFVRNSFDFIYSINRPSLNQLGQSLKFETLRVLSITETVHETSYAILPGSKLNTDWSQTLRE